MISLTLFVALSCLATRVFADDEVNDPDVVVLGADNFDKIAVDTPTLLVEFYAPWCGHCKRLAPEYAVAATALLKEDPPVVLGKVDATIHGELAEKYGVQGYPTLKIFRNGVASEYNGPRDSAGIIKYMRAQSGPAARVLADAAALDAFTASSSSDEVVHVAFVDEGSDEEAAFLAVANRRRDDFRFGVASGADVLKAAGVAAPAVVAFRPASFESTRQEFAGDYTTDNIDAFVVQSALPLAGVYDQSNAKQYALAGLPRVTVWTRVDMVSAPKQARYYLNRLKKVAAGYVGKAKFVLEDKTAREFADLGFDGAAEFGLGAIDADGRKYRSDISKFSVDALDAFAQAFVAGELEVYMKSEPVPESQDDAVITVVGKTFEELVHDENKDVLIEFYAPWCGHCKSLTPKYEELATQMSEHSTVRIAKIDATANDVPPEYNVRGFPTIYLQKNDGSAPVAYEGAREVADFKKFLKKNVLRKLSKKASKEEL